jgi:hypothetical protein
MRQPAPPRAERGSAPLSTRRTRATELSLACSTPGGTGRSRDELTLHLAPTTRRSRLSFDARLARQDPRTHPRVVELPSSCLPSVARAPPPPIVSLQAAGSASAQIVDLASTRSRLRLTPSYPLGTSVRRPPLRHGARDDALALSDRRGGLLHATCARRLPLLCASAEVTTRPVVLSADDAFNAHAERLRRVRALELGVVHRSHVPSSCLPRPRPRTELTASPTPPPGPSSLLYSFLYTAVHGSLRPRLDDRRSQRWPADPLAGLTLRRLHLPNAACVRARARLSSAVVVRCRYVCTPQAVCRRTD